MQRPALPTSGPISNVLMESHRLSKELWQVRVDAARALYEAAAAELRHAVDSRSPGDAWQEILEIRFREANALSQYLDALHAFDHIFPPLPS